MSTATRDHELDATGEAKKKVGGGALRCLVVTPESTLLDEPADFVVLPLLDGELGVGSGRAPMIGRIGSGELRIRTAGRTTHLFLDGGFAQVRDNVVNVLTMRAMPLDQLDATLAATELEQAKARTGTSEFDLKEKERAVERARAKIRLASRRTGPSH
jgi:F-type H+-transporting ATPase subunit epsilon